MQAVSASPHPAATDGLFNRIEVGHARRDANALVQQKIAERADGRFKRRSPPRDGRGMHELQAVALLGVEWEVSTSMILPREKKYTYRRWHRECLILIDVREGRQKIDVRGRPADFS